MLEAIKNIINPEVVLQICNSNQTLTIKENNTNSKINKLHIKGVPEDAFAFTLDYQSKDYPRCFQQLSCYINKAKDKVNKGCDLVLLIPKNNDDWQILIFDLKSDKPKKKDTNEQLLNSELYVRYLLSMLEKHDNIDINKVKFKRAIVTTNERNISKNFTYSPNKNQYSAETLKKIPVMPNTNNEAYVYLNQLIEKI